MITDSNIKFIFFSFIKVFIFSSSFFIESLLHVQTCQILLNYIGQSKPQEIVLPIKSLHKLYSNLVQFLMI